MQEGVIAFHENASANAWRLAYQNGGSLSSELAALAITPRAPLVGSWLKSGDLGFIYAARGIGKSWLSMYLAKGLAAKIDVGPWKVHARARVLYLDGEMPPEDVRERDSLLGPPSDQLAYVNHELLFARTGKVMNMADLGFQSGTLEYCLEAGYNVLFADNLSTLASGVDENKSIDWELILPWLLTLPRNHITVIIVHHASRGGQMRGTSKREDPAFWILRLDEDSTAEDQIGARFISRFTKWRNAAALPETWRWHFRPIPGTGDIDITYQEASPLFVFIHWVASGLDTCSDIAAEIDCSRGYISKLARKASSLGRIRINGRRYLCLEE